MAVTTYPLPHERARPRRIARTDDGHIWYTDYSRGKLGRLDPATKRVTEYDLPGGAGSLPYGMIADDQGRIWVAETGTKPNRLVGFDVATGTFLPPVEVGDPAAPNTIRHMTYDPRTRAIWYGDDQGHLGRAIVPVRRNVM
jgi:virginiamycin B lyase